MEAITPFTSAAQAIETLDNGGKFYNIFTKADDDIISPGEVSKMAGVVFEKQKSILYLQLAMDKLSPREQLEIEGRFDDTLSDNFLKYKPIHIHNADGLEKAELNANAIVSGTPKLLEAEGHITGFIMIPVIDTFTMIPISESYLVYELIPEDAGEPILIAHSKDIAPLPLNPLRLGAVIKQFQLGVEETSENQRFLEVSYYYETV